MENSPTEGSDVGEKKRTPLRRLRGFFSKKLRTIFSPEKGKKQSRPWAKVVQSPEGRMILLWGLGDGSGNGSFPLSTGGPFRIDLSDTHLKYWGEEEEVLFGGSTPEINRLLSREIERALRKTQFRRSFGSHVRLPLLPTLAGAGIVLFLVFLFPSGGAGSGERLTSLSQVEKAVSQGIPDSFPGLGGGLTCHGGGH